MTVRPIAACLTLALCFAAGAASADPLLVSQTGGGPAAAGQTRTFVITVSTGPSAPVPPNLEVEMHLNQHKTTLVSASGVGWACSITNGGAYVDCTRSDGLAAGALFPAITVTSVIDAAPGEHYSSCARAKVEGQQPGEYGGGGCSGWIVDGHDPRRSTAHDLRRSESQHDPRRSGSHDLRRSQPHDRIRSQPHDPRRSQPHDPRRSETHDTQRSQPHDPRRSETHDTQRSQPHDPRRSETHDTQRSQTDVA